MLKKKNKTYFILGYRSQLQIPTSNLTFFEIIAIIPSLYWINERRMTKIINENQKLNKTNGKYENVA